MIIKTDWVGISLIRISLGSFFFNFKDTETWGLYNIERGSLSVKLSKELKEFKYEDY